MKHGWVPMVLAPREPDKTRGSWWLADADTVEDVIADIERQTGQTWEALQRRGWWVMNRYVKEPT